MSALKGVDGVSSFFVRVAIVQKHTHYIGTNISEFDLRGVFLAAENAVFIVVKRFIGTN